MEEVQRIVTGREDDCLMRNTVVEGMTHGIRTPGQKNQYLTDIKGMKGGKIGF